MSQTLIAHSTRKVPTGRGAGSQVLPLPGGGSAGGASPTSLLCGLEHNADLVSQVLCLTQRTHMITLTWLCLWATSLAQKTRGCLA